MIPSRRLSDEDTRLSLCQIPELLGSILLQKTHASARKRAIQFINLGGDVIEPGAFAKTLADKGGEVPILWQHDSREPMGLGKLSDSSEGLVVKGELALESPVAQKAYGLLKRGVLRGLSIGYDDVKSKVVGGVRRIVEMKLWEVSLVTFPMNTLAQVSEVKSQQDISEEIREFRELLKSFRG